jgi:hypothetical protein
MKTIITNLRKKLLMRSISTAMLTKQRISALHMEYYIVHEVMLAEDPQSQHAARDKEREAREIWKLLL